MILTPIHIILEYLLGVGYSQTDVISLFGFLVCFLLIILIGGKKRK